MKIEKREKRASLSRGKVERERKEKMKYSLPTAYIYAIHDSNPFQNRPII